MSFFMGPRSDNQEKIYQYLDKPVMARYIRFYPAHWSQHISMRAGVLVQRNPGPNTKNPADYMLDNPEEKARSYSSVWGNDPIGVSHATSMLDSKQAWSAARNDANQWMTIDLGSTKPVGGVVTQGRFTSPWSAQMVNSFKLGYSTDGTNFTVIQPDYNSETFGTPIHYRSVFRPDACVDNAAGGQGTQFTVWECSDSNVNQKIVRGPNDSIIMANTGLCMDVAGASQSNAGPVHQWPCHGGENQKWIYNSDDKTIRPKHAPNKCLDVLGWNRANGAKLGIWDCEGRANQQWFLDEIKLPNPFSHLPLPERCPAYEKLIKSSQNRREQDRYKVVYGEECLPEYQNRAIQCNQEKDRKIIEENRNRDKCHKELKSCVKEFHVKKKGTIESAWYGPINGGKAKTYNVKPILEMLQRTNKKRLTVNRFSMGGDPAPNEVKFLFINYRTPMGEFRKYKIPENGVFDLNFPHTNVGLRQKGGAAAEECEDINIMPKQQQQKRVEGPSRATQRGGCGTIRGISSSLPAAPYTSFVADNKMMAPQSTEVQKQERVMGMGRSRSQSGSGWFNNCSAKKIIDDGQLGGAKKKPLIDKSPYCTEWAARNPSECVINENFMNTKCPKSCADYKLNIIDKSKPPEIEDPQTILGTDPLNDDTEYGFSKHRDFPTIMREYVPNDACDDIKEYVLKSDVIEAHQKALNLITEIKALDNINRLPISQHPQYKQTMERYALGQGDGTYRSCQLCPSK